MNRGPQAPRSWRNAAQRRPQLQRQPRYDFTAGGRSDDAVPPQSYNVSQATISIVGTL
jgi:hypothetical protein